MPRLWGGIVAGRLFVSARLGVLAGNCGALGARFHRTTVKYPLLSIHW
jgi:hypothetical protein